jgi:predicted outer membrane repeat protein
VLCALCTTTYAQTLLCSVKPVALRVANTQDAVKLAEAALCDNAHVSATWQGNVQLAKTIVVGNGTSLTVRAAATAKTAIIDGGNKVQLFDVWGALTVINMTLTNGFTVDFGGAIYSRADAAVNGTGSVFSGHQARFGGAILLNHNSLLHISGCEFSNNSCSETGGALYSSENTSLTVLN